MNIRDVIARDIDIPLSMIDSTLSVARQEVKKFLIEKKNGNFRVIVQPSKRLKTIQYWLIINVFKKMQVHESAYAYIEGRSILDNAARHRDNKYFLKLDFKDFFPSITFVDLLPKITQWHTDTNPEWDLTTEALNLIRLSCFFHGNKLAIGYPTSPVISNIVMFDFDKEMTSTLKNESKYGEVVYTRYADDLVISTNKRNVNFLLLTDISKIISNTVSPKVELNLTKTKMGTSSAGSASVTGLKVCDDGHITIHKTQKDHIRLLLSLYRKGSLKSEEHNSLLGHLAYVQHVDGAFYTRLQKKYFKEIFELRHPNV